MLRRPRTPITYKEKPTLFIGSTAESLDWAKAAQAELEDVAGIARWDQGNFPSGWTTLQSLLQIANSYDFALFIMSGEDVVVSREKRSPAVRDNVLFEYGLFVGKIGPERTFYLFDRSNPPKLPSDLFGLTCLGYNREHSATIPADKKRVSLSSACHEIRASINRLGSRLGIERSEESTASVIANEIEQSPIPIHIEKTAIKIAIIEDEIFTANLLARILRIRGFNVAVFHDGEMGCEAVLKGDFDAVISDWGLPNKSGVEICKSLKSNPITSKIIFVLISGYGNSFDVDLAYSNGVDLYFTKPVPSEQLSGMVDFIKKNARRTIARKKGHSPRRKP